VDFPHFIKKIIKSGYMKKKLLVLLIAVIPTLMPNLASAVGIDVEFYYSCGEDDNGSPLTEQGSITPGCICLLIGSVYSCV